IGGTVGDIESLPFLEAIRQFALDVGKQNCLYIHLTLIPYLKAAGELKTKPTQHSVGRLREIGIQADILICRTERAMSKDDAYKSVYEAIDHAGISLGARVLLRKVSAEEVEREGAEKVLSGVDGVLVPGGFGDRGIEGKIEAIRHVRERGLPFFGICLGLQC